jgi:hypothetical protein
VDWTRSVTAIPKEKTSKRVGMLNDPYIEVINKARSLDINEDLVEESINIFLTEGTVKALAALKDKNIAGDKAGSLLQIIKKEFKTTYRVNALYAGVFMLLFFFFSTVLFLFSNEIGFWMIFSFTIFIYCAYRFLRNLHRASAIK